MDGVPRLVDLCMAAIADELLGDDINDMLLVIYELPPELFDSLLPHLPPLALQKLQENLESSSVKIFSILARASHITNICMVDMHSPAFCMSCLEGHLTSGITLNMLIITVEIVENEEGWEERYGILDSAWEALYKVRWPCFSEAKQSVGWLDKYDEAKYQSVDDWQQICVDAVAETALLPSYDGSLGEIQIPDGILEHIGCKGHLIKLTPDYLKFSNHCQQFGVYARCCNLVREDADCLKQALVHMPNLQNLDLSDNSFEDGISEIGAPFGKFLCTGVRAVDVEDIGLGSSGFLEALREISMELKIAYINISNNQGGIEAANFISSIISHSQKIVAIGARYNLMPMESLSVISSGIKASKGKLKHLDLAGNSFCDQLADAASILAELQIHGQGALSLSLWAAPSAPYDDDP
ncbi:UNVERIFIED_CONTAM: hypothetical protein Scaly_0443200 [Sesamum calycinum]|uniref:Uncharacterized protein n=1 Tax=Sesamum calycinum TaxID=2727403 RepID=A0AAW2SEA6_9LAMI